MDSEEVFKLYLDHFKNDLWIERRFKMDELIDYLQQLRTVHERPSDSSIDDFVEFFKYLKKQCSGIDFNNDKQWSELLKLMQISRKLNHKSVKLKDLVMNKQLIEANADSIRKLNEKAKLYHNIESMLSDLDLLTRKCSIELPPSITDDSLFILSDISKTRTYLQNRCRPLLYTLKFEIDNEFIAEEVDSENWLIKIQNLSDVIEKLESFCNSLYEFQSKLLDLKPLMNIGEGHSIESRNDKRELSSSLNLCKVKFRSIQEVNRKLLEYLCTLRDRKSKTKKENRQLIMINLVSTSKNNTKFVDELYDSQLAKALLELDECRHELDTIMMNLRIEFGRFYFVNDVELLTIIALDSTLVYTKEAATDIEKQSLISKLFNNAIDGFKVKDNKFIIGVKSPLNEVILIQGDAIPIKKKVSIYSTEIVRILNECSRKLRKTLKTMLIRSLNEPMSDNEIDWSLPVQLMNLAEHIKFCRKVEISFDDQSLDSLLGFYECRLRQLCKSSANVELENCTPLDELKKSAAISLTVQYISIITKLEINQVKSKDSWNWKKNVRYYYKSESNDEQGVEVEIANASFRYRFDYLPIQIENAEGKHKKTFKRLIGTQLTDKCILMASQSICNFKLGANPYGPAGSGKTETIKALGHSLGCQVIVHNCTESNDSNSLEMLIFGLAHTGLWGCFDEFNRLSSSVLSTVSAALELVQTNLRENKTTIELANGEQMMSIDKDCAFFVTLNPSDETKYRGRRKLPANLRNLFLPISMIRVEIDSIVSEKLLILSGKLDGVSADDINYNLSEVLFQSGRKFHLLIEWMKENLKETSGRCEWDLRFVISVLRRLKAKSIIQNRCLNVDTLLLESIQTELEPRLTKEEIELFHGGAAEVFNSSSNRLDQGYYCSLDKLNTEIDRTGMKYSSEIGRYVLNLQELLATRTGVMLLGPSGVGKSTIWRLSQRLKGNSEVKFVAINPRACQKKELFGFVDPSKNKWVDGLFTLKVREAIKMLQSSTDLVEQFWIILDGPVDPDWIESLNSVMDDNQVLTLSSGERLDFYLPSGKSIKLIFETTSIDLASPATISRLGLLYVESMVFESK